MKLNIGNMFANRAFLTPDLEACIGEEYRYSYRKMNQRINRFAAYLSKSGITQGDRIAILAKNNEQVLTTLFGAAKIGAITVVLNFRLQGPELDYILNNSGSKTLVYGDRILQKNGNRCPPGIWRHRVFRSHFLLVSGHGG